MVCYYTKGYYEVVINDVYGMWHVTDGVYNWEWCTQYMNKFGHDDIDTGGN